jgi:Zn-dependent protease with chaperone function
MSVDIDRTMSRTSGSAVFFDGRTSARNDVTVELAPDRLRVRGLEGSLFAEWPYTDLESVVAPADRLRITQSNSPVLARLEIRDPELITAIDDLSHPIDRSGRRERRARGRVIAWTLAATAMLVLIAVFGVPALATRLAPHIPYALENHLGAAVDAQVRTMLDTRKLGSGFACGHGAQEAAGRAALAKLVTRLETAAALPIGLHVTVVRRPQANALALPGGHIYVFQGLIDKAVTPDEFAGVLAHEIGHVANRDGTRSVLQVAGLSFLFGMVLGDFVGGAAVVLAARTLLHSNYSREVEAAADRYSVALMITANADPHALAAILSRIAVNTRPQVRLLRNHPDAHKRVEAIKATSAPAARIPLLDDAEWAALKRICAEG